MLKIQDTQSRMSLLIYMMQRIRLLVILLRLEERSLQWKRYGHFISKRNSPVTTIYTKISTLLHYPEITPEGEFSSNCNSSNQGLSSSIQLGTPKIIIELSIQKNDSVRLILEFLVLQVVSLFSISWVLYMVIKKVILKDKP